MTIENTVREQENRKEKIYSLISLLLSVILSTAACYVYYIKVPPDDPARQRMRIFFRENINEVMEFVQLHPEEQKKSATGKKHPFYKKYTEASVVEKEKIKALVHVSTDYRPNQYWVNIAFLWTICFTTLWFLGKMTEGALVLMGHKKRRS